MFDTEKVYVTDRKNPRTQEAWDWGKKYAKAMPKVAAGKRYNTNALLLIDTQNDFIQPDGSLSVPGAVEDTHRTIELIYRDVWHIDQLYVSLDTHLPNQIFFASWWQDAQGNEPAAFTIITARDVRDGKWRTKDSDSRGLGTYLRSLDYVEQLEKNGRNQLIIWPYHCIEGTPGHAVVPALSEAITFWSAVHGKNPVYVVKGLDPETENYSVFEAEVERSKGSEINTDLLDELESYDRIYVAGQAKSHCVLSSLETMVAYYEMNYDADAISGKINVLLDCMSSVYSPVIDFESIASVKLSKMVAGKQLELTSTANYIR